MTFRAAFEAYYTVKRESLSNAKHRAQWQSTMGVYVFPRIGDRLVAEVTASEVIAVLTPIWFEKPETAKRVLQRIEAVFKSAIVRGHRKTASPCIGVAQELGTRHRTVTNRRALPYAEVPSFLEFVAHLQKLACHAPGVRMAGPHSQPQRRDATGKMAGNRRTGGTLDDPR